MPSEQLYPDAASALKARILGLVQINEFLGAKETERSLFGVTLDPFYLFIQSFNICASSRFLFII